MWFDKLMGFKENTPKQVRENILINRNKLTSLVNGKEYIFGKLQVPTLESYRENTTVLHDFSDRIKLSEIVGDIQSIHKDPENAGAFFQAASQFNLLEMVGPEVTPERGVAIYENDFTQGPACAIACGAGTIYRNYFAEVNGEIGQTKNNQIDCLEEIGKELDNENLHLWHM